MSDNAKNAAKVIPITSASMSPAVRAQVARLPAPVHDVQTRGKLFLQKAIQGLFDNVDDALFELADKANNNRDQNLYFDSMRQVRIQRRAIEERFIEALSSALADLATEGKARETSYAADTEELSLVDNEDLEELVAIDAMINRATEAAGEPLQYFCIRLDSLVPAKVYHKNNPYGPHVVCNNFVEATGQLAIDIKAKMVLFKLFEQYVVATFPQLYETLNKVLIDHNILPSLKPHTVSRSIYGQTTTTQTPQGATQAPANAQAPGQTQAQFAQPAAPGGTLTAVDKVELSRLLSKLQQQQVSQWSSATPGAAVPTVADVTPMLLQLAQARSATVAKADTDVVNLVKMLFEFILRDGSLAAPMKALISRLQIPIVKVALIDRSFFHKGGHPARRLLNEMATACLGWQEGQIPADRDPLFQKITTIVDQLLNEFEEDVEIFSEVLADFVSFNEREKRRARILEKRALDAEDGKAKAELARQQVSAALNQRTHGRALPKEVANILSGPWSNVLFLISLKGGTESADWQQAIKTVDQLVWSACANLEGDNQRKLLALLPVLLKNVRQGLELIAHNPFETTSLLKGLEKLHIGRLRAIAVKSDPIIRPKAEAAKADSTPVQAAQVAPAQPTQDASRQEEKQAEPEAQTTAAPSAEQTSASGNKTEAAQAPVPAAEEVEAAVATSAAATSATASENSVPVEDHYLGLVRKLTHGTWFEASDADGQSFRCRLAAIIKVTGNYIFVNRNGVKVAEESERSLALALQTGKLRLLDDGMLFDRALESVIGHLRKSKPERSSN